MRRFVQLLLTTVVSLALSMILSGGGSIVAAEPPQPEFVYSSVQFPTHDAGFVLAAKHGNPYLLTTLNDGRSWAHETLPFRPGWMQLVNATDGWAVDVGPECSLCHEHLYRTANGGRTWRVLKDLGNWRTTPGQVQFVSAAEGWVHYRPCGRCRGVTMRTDDGGWTWTRAHWPFTTSFYWRFSSLNAGWAVEPVTKTPARRAGGPKKILKCVNKLFRTDNGGRTWKIWPKQPACYELPVFANANDGWMVMDPQPAGNCAGGGCLDELMKTVDGGQTWQVQQTLKQDEGKRPWTGRWGGFPDLVAFPSTSHGWIDISAGAGPEDGGVAVTSDGGNHWRRYLHGYRDPSLAVIAPSEAWVASANVSGVLPSALLHTNNDGGHWATVDPQF